MSFTIISKTVENNFRGYCYRLEPSFIKSQNLVFCHDFFSSYFLCKTVSFLKSKLFAHFNVKKHSSCIAIDNYIEELKYTLSSNGNSYDF